MTKHLSVVVTASVATLLALFAPAPVARADIFKWEYVNPANPSQGKQQSTTLTPGGAGVNAAPGADLSFRNLTMAYLISADLTGAYAQDANLSDADLSQANLTNAYLGGYDYCNDSNCEWIPGANLTNANLSQANLTNAWFNGATLSGANLTGAEVRGATLSITMAQLYSTASYQAHDLTGINLPFNNLSGANLVGQNLTYANFNGAILTGANISQANLTNADFSFGAQLSNANLSQANLTNANLSNATLSGANFSGAEVRGANFSRDWSGTGITAAQLYTTASYLSHDLSGIRLDDNDLTGVNLAGKNLTNANFRHAALANANLSQSNLTNANFSGHVSCDEYGCITTPGADLSGANLSQANLTGADFSYAPLTDANLTGTDVRGVDFTRHDDYQPDSGISIAQLYSTASYQAHDLTGINLSFNDMTGANFASQNLTNANLYGATLTGASFHQANLTNAQFGFDPLTGVNFTGAEVRGARFSGYGAGGISIPQLYSTASYQAHDLTGIQLDANNLAGINLAGQNLTNAFFISTTLTGANLSGADARGANFNLTTLGGATTSNLIQSDGHISGLDLSAGASLVVRDNDGSPYYVLGPIPIRVDEHLAMGPGGTLRLVFDADPWDSTISFAPGISVTRGGTLELTFAPDVNLASQVGRTINLFNWTGVTPSGAFTISSPYTWNLTNLYTTGEVTLTAVPNLPGDFNHDDTVDAADYVVWRKNPGGIYTQNDFNTWRAHFGATLGSGADASANVTVPEPTTLALLMLVTASCCIRRGHAAKRIP